MVRVIVTDRKGNTSEGNLYGSDNRIIENANYSNSIRSYGNQIVKLNIVRTGKDTGYPGCEQRDIEYNFKYDENKKQYVY